MRLYRDLTRPQVESQPTSVSVDLAKAGPGPTSKKSPDTKSKTAPTPKQQAAPAHRIGSNLYFPSSNPSLYVSPDSLALTKTEIPAPTACFSNSGMNSSARGLLVFFASRSARSAYSNVIDLTPVKSIVRTPFLQGRTCVILVSFAGYIQAKTPGPPRQKVGRNPRDERYNSSCESLPKKSKRSRNGFSDSKPKKPNCGTS